MKEDNGSLKFLIIVVQNGEHIIEGIIRQALRFQYQSGRNVKLIIVDLNSQDSTLEIIKKMAYPNDYYTLVSIRDRQELDVFLEKYIMQDCLIMDYSLTKKDMSQSINTCKSI
jgi:glycosyltransferase involved in cell wall biosynthesis